MSFLFGAAGPPPTPSAPVDVEFMKGEILRPLAAGAALNLLLCTAHAETRRFVLLSGFLLQYMLILAALAVVYSELTDDVEPCSQIIGYCGSISCPGGVAYPQAQSFLMLQALILNASLLYAVRRQATRRASSYDQAPPWYKLLTCRWAALCWGGPDTATHQTSWLGLPGCAAGPVGWAAGGAKRACETGMLLGGGFLLVTGLYPAIPEPVAFCASAEACTTSFVATWHQRCVFLGGGLLFSGVLCRLVLALVAGQRPACWFGTEVPALLGLVYFGGRSLITFTEATNRNISWLPRLKVCYLHDTEASCAHPGWGPTPPEAWPCVWAPNVALPNRPCTDPACIDHVADNFLAITHEVHVAFFALSILAACLALIERLEAAPPGAAAEADLGAAGDDATPLLGGGARRGMLWHPAPRYPHLQPPVRPKPTPPRLPAPMRPKHPPPQPSVRHTPTPPAQSPPAPPARPRGTEATA